MKQKETLRRVLSYLRPYGALLVLSLILAVVTVALTLYIPILTGDAVDCLVDRGAVDFAALAPILMQIAVVAVLTALSQWIMGLCNNRLTLCTVRDIRAAAFRKLQNLPTRYFDGHSNGDTVSRIIADADQLSDGLLLGFTQLFTGVITILGTILFMLSVNVVITLVVVLVTPLSLLVASFIAKRTYAMFTKQSVTRGEQTALIEEMVGGVKLVQAFGQQEQVMERFDEVNERLKKYSLRAIFFSSITNPATRFINSLVYAGVGVTGAFSALTGAITVGQLTVFLSYANQYTKPFNEISGVVTELQNALACAGRIFALLDEEEETPDSPDAVTPDHYDGAVELRDVAFSYTPEQSLITGLNLQVHPGQRIAIVGPTGCGKTTLINLLMRFYDVCGGSIAVDGTDIRELTRSGLRRGFGMVLQDTWLETATIAENIAMGRPDATREEIEAAAKQAHAHSFICRLPQGYDTMVENGGESLSQGQRQLLCIARVMLCRPPMLILDEATSSIDTRTEQKIQSAFLKLMEGRTAFIVAHRLSTIREADVILVMRDGHIIEQGSHAELLARKGFYAQLYESQFAV
ncbi:ABC transporter ATP-binding protein [Candidatus Avoscillospira sp. LCP25S3_F1]|uniref:ABC transporter ATP-binding protein n=1 Tax=Candidatus Avoscillospira sp. LCP25S3_F1 TaxID=3438825 RepID=UPI003F92B7FE